MLQSQTLDGIRAVGTLRRCDYADRGCIVASDDFSLGTRFLCVLLGAPSSALNISKLLAHSLASDLNLTNGDTRNPPSHALINKPASQRSLLLIFENLYRTWQPFLDILPPGRNAPFDKDARGLRNPRWRRRQEQETVDGRSEAPSTQ